MPIVSCHVRRALLAAGLAMVSPSGPYAHSQTGPSLGGLLVAPTRVVFEGRRRAAELTLVNRGAEPATYRISFVEMRMDLGGGLQVAEAVEPGERPAEPLVRYSPRQVELQPGEAQTVRLMVRKPAELESGEYRSHLVLRSVPPVEGSDPSTSTEAAPTGGFGVRLIPLYGVSVPIILRHGETSATLVLEDLELVDASPRSLRLTLKRGGNRSVFGDLLVEWRPRRGPPREIGRMRKLAVYTPNPEREVAVPLVEDLGTLADGVIEVRFENGEDGDLRGAVLASGTLPLP